MGGVRTVGWWGMTETVSHGIVSDPWLPQRPLAIGQPAPEYEIRVLGADGRTPAGRRRPDRSRSAASRACRCSPST